MFLMAYITDNFQMNADLSSRKWTCIKLKSVSCECYAPSKKTAIPIHVPSYVSELKRTELNVAPIYFFSNITPEKNLVKIWEFIEI